MSAPAKPDDVARDLSAMSLSGTAAASSASTAAASSSSDAAAAASASAAAASPAAAAPASASSTAVSVPAALRNAAASSGMTQEELDLLLGAVQKKPPSKAEAAKEKEYKFWNTQPVPKIG